MIRDTVESDRDVSSATRAGVAGVTARATASLLVDCDPWEEVLHVGVPMEMTIGPLMKDASGEDLYTDKFRPAGAGKAAHA